MDRRKKRIQFAQWNLATTHLHVMALTLDSKATGAGRTGKVSSYRIC